MHERALLRKSQRAFGRKHPAIQSHSNLHDTLSECGVSLMNPRQDRDYGSQPGINLRAEPLGAILHSTLSAVVHSARWGVLECMIAVWSERRGSAYANPFQAARMLAASGQANVIAFIGWMERGGSPKGG